MTQPQYPWQPAPVAPVGPPGPRRTGLLVTVVVLVVALAAAATVAVVQTDRLSDQRARTAAAQAQAQAAQAEVERLEDELAAARAQADTAEEPDAGGPLGEGGLEDLFGGGGLFGDEELGGLGDALEELFGEGGLGGLDGLLDGAGAAPDVSACTSGVADLPDVEGGDLQAQLDQTAEVVQDLRGHTFDEPIQPELLTAEEIREALQEEIAESYPPEVADAERRTYGLLEAVPDDIDLVAVQTDLLGDQVAGFYDDEARRLVVRVADPADRDQPLGATGLITLAHELEHALVDEAIGLPPLDEFDADDDGALAALAVVEGSAVALQSQFQLSALDPLALLGDLGAVLGAGDGLDQVPPLIRESLLFPYLTGPGYVCGLYADGGWDAVDAAIADPPATTHAIMFPDDGVTAPVDVPVPEGPAEMDLVDRRSFGAATLSWLFAAPGGDASAALTDPVAAVRPWRGGELSLWTRDATSAVALVLDGEGLCGPVTEWWAATATVAAPAGTPTPGADEELVAGTDDGTWGVVTCVGTDVRVGIGPDVDVARAVVR